MPTMVLGQTAPPGRYKVPVLVNSDGSLVTSGVSGGAAGSAGTYSATAPTLTDGGSTAFTFDERGRVRVTSGPATEHEAVTPSDSVNFTGISRGIYVGVGGNVTAVVNGVAVLYTAVPAGMILPIRATRINATGTLASALVALF